MAQNRKKLTDTSDDFMSEGMAYGGMVGGVFFVFSALTGHASAGAVCVIIGVVVGMLLGMSIKKEKKNADSEKERAISTYKKLDRERNAFFPDTAVKKYNPKIQRPMLRTRIANGERMAGFKDLVTGHFNEVMIISKDEDIEEFMRRYGIASKNEIEGL